MRFRPRPGETSPIQRLDTRSGPLGTQPLETVVALPPEITSSFRTVLRNPAFLRLWIAQAFSQTAQNMIWWALFLQIAHLTNKTTLGVGVGILMVQLPTIMFAGLSGVLVDRFSKHSILVSSNAVRAVGCLGYLLLLDNVTALYAITFAVAVVNQPFQPAETATIPLLVGEKQLLAANALFQITFLASQVIGYTVAPLMVALPFLGISKTLMVGVFFLAIAALALVGLPPVTRERRQFASTSIVHAALQMLTELVDVSKVLTKDAQLTVALVQLSMAPAVLLVLSELGPKYVQQLLGTGQTNAMIVLVAPAGAGLGLGLFLIDRIGAQMPKGRVASAAMIAMGVALAALAVVPNVTGVLLSNLHVSRTLGASCMTIPISFVLGVATALLNAPAQTIVQERADTNLRGKVLAVQQALAAAVTIPPLILVGFVGQLLTISQTLGILAAVVVVAGVLSRRVVV